FMSHEASNMIDYRHHKSEPHFRGLYQSVSFIAVTAVLLVSPGLGRTQDAPATAPQAEAQGEARPADAPVVPGTETASISSIRVEGNVRVDSETIVSYMPIQAGQTVNSAMIDE